MIEPLIDKFVEGQPVTFGDTTRDRPWKEKIKNTIGRWDRENLNKSSVILDFSLDTSSFMRRGKQYLNDLDNRLHLRYYMEIPNIKLTVV